jgi:MFS family permease
VSIFPLGLVAAVWWLVGLRLVTGLGEAGFFIGAATSVQDLAPAHRRGEAASFFSTSIYGGLAIGPVVGETLYHRVGAGAVWVFAGVMCAVATLLSTFIPRSLGRVEEPPPRRGLLHPASVLPGSILLLGLFGFAGYSAFVPLYVDEIGIDDAAPFFLVYGVLVLFVRILGARLPDRLGPVRASSLALGAIGLGIGCVAAFASAAGLWVGTVLLALGMSLLFPALFTLAVNNAPDDERSHAVGSFSLFFDLSQGLGAPILGVIVTLTGAERPAFLASAVVAGVGMYLTNTRLRAAVRTSA